MDKTSFSFDQSVIERSKNIPVIVEFSSPGCGPCVWMEKALIELTKKNNGRFEFVSIPLTGDSSFIKNYNITSNPTTILFDDGLPKVKLKGALPLMVLQQWVDDHL